MNILFLYLSHEGQTKKIIDRLLFDLKSYNDTIDSHILPLKEQADMSEQELESYDFIVLAASIRYGHFPALLKRFINKHTALLNRKKTAFISVNLTARKPDKNTPQTNVYTRKLLEQVTWQPSLVAVFAGALYYPRYNVVDRVLIQFIMRITGGETDSSKEIEYTDWQQVQNFAQQISSLL